MPYQIIKGQNMQFLNYTYDASGTKHKKVYYGYGIRPVTTTYTPNAVYKNNNLEMVFTPEGYAQPTAGGFTHVYQYKDHLGNNRLSFADSNKNGKIDTPRSTGITLWEDGFEDKGTGDWESVGAKYGRKITGFDTTKPRYVAAIRYGGYTNAKKEATHKQKLLQSLEENDISAIGEVEILGYDSPYKFYNRRNEIMVVVAYTK